MNNPEDRADISLTTFNGLVSELKDSDIPSGTSPLTWDMDFTPGAVRTRSGLQSVLNASNTNNFNSVYSYTPTSGKFKTFALDAAGKIWTEDITTNPGVLVSFYDGITAGAYMKALTQFEREWMCFSNLQEGTDIPRQYTSAGNFDRISQTGPGAPPSLASSANNYAITSVTQPPQSEYIVGPSTVPGHFSNVNWGASAPDNRHAGNVLTIFYNRDTNPADPKIKPGAVIQLTDMPNIAGHNPNGTYIIDATGDSPPDDGAGKRYWFSVHVSQTANEYHNANALTGNYHITAATVKTTTPIPNVTAGGQLTLTGVTPSAWNNSWTISATLNSGQFQITQTSVTATIGSYTYIVVSGVAPVAGETITVTGCNNSSVFNVANATVFSASAGIFRIELPLSTPDISAAPENGNAVTGGTQFQIDPGLTHLGQVGDPGYISSVFGNGVGGNIAVPGDVAAGVRQCVCIFKTRNSYLTAPSKPVVFSTAGGNKLSVSNIPIGPPNVSARILAFTGADGGYFFWIPEPVTITGTGQSKTYDATIINDNTTTQASFDFTDEILLAALSIDTPGSNLFNLVELGNPVWNVSYASRMFYGMENNKVQNIVNSTFDGGYLPSNPTLPAGWTANPTYNGGGSISVSPIFGNSYTITGDGSAFNGWISQSAYQDYYQVPIIRVDKSYSARITCRSVGGGSGSLRLSLTSPQFNAVYGSIDIQMSDMTSTMQVFVVPLMSAINPVPLDMTLHLMGVNLSGAVEVDRFEIFPDDQPTLSTEVQASYAFDPESFDGVSGAIGVDQQNNQTVFGAYVQYNLLYFLKENSIYSTQDTPRSEPSGWTLKEVSNRIGTCGPLAYDYGEEWLVTAHRSGLYLFHSDVTKISQEISTLWEWINWDAGQTIWVRNDVTNRRILVGVPMITPNPWLPTDGANTPTSPSHILMLRYMENNSGQQLAEKSAIHVSFSGSLVSFPTARDWSIWHIAAPSANFIKRGA